jgi:hypothetical protein
LFSATAKIGFHGNGSVVIANGVVAPFYQRAATLDSPIDVLAETVDGRGGSIASGAPQNRQKDEPKAENRHNRLGTQQRHSGTPTSTRVLRPPVALASRRRRPDQGNTHRVGGLFAAVRRLEIANGEPHGFSES